MKKENALKYFDEQTKRDENLIEMERHNIIKQMRNIADELEESSYLNTYKVEKLLKSIEEYKNWKNEYSTHIAIYNAVSSSEMGE
jgi:adenosine deaminase